MNHPGQTDLLAVLAGTAPEESAEEVWGHVAACPACEERYHALRALRDDLDGALETAGLARGPSRLVRVRGFLEAGVGALGSFLGGDAGLTLAPAAPGGIGGPGDDDGRDAADRAWDMGRPGEARSLLGELFRMDGPAAARREIVLQRDGDEVLRVVIDAERREVAVLLRDGLGDVLVFLVPRYGTLRRADVGPVEGADYSLALFRDVEPGRFDLVLERPPADG